MANVSTYLNFMGQTEEAFNFYGKIFGTKPTSITRMGDFPADPNQPALSDKEQEMIMNIQMPILADHVIMGTDMLESMGHKLIVGNNITINLDVDTRAETERLYNALSAGGDSTQCSPLADMPWDSYWGTCLDKFGIRWMFNCYQKA